MRRNLLQLWRSPALFGIAALALGAGPWLPARAAEKGRIVEVKVHGRALEGNLEGESADRDVLIYLPPSYASNTARRYPVVYLLHGYLVSNRYWIGAGLRNIVPGVDVPGAMNKDIANATGREMIVVMPDARTKYGGSMYSSSVTSGDWESYIADDLVEYIDSHYRTLAASESRGLAGHGIGGYGTIRIAMKHPGVFSSIYILSACCLMNNPAAFARYNTRKDRGRAEGDRDADDASPPIGDVVRAEAAAWSPDPRKPPSFFDLPDGSDDASDALIIAKWAANSPLAMIDQYIPSLKRGSAIGMDVGSRDGLKFGNAKLSEVLTAYGIAHSFETYQGNHVDHIGRRIEQKVIPFFSQHLAFGKNP
ncbi:MAG TPA: alpha/beta hydrolase-fold protein [Gammaproteobacteria bacterium]|nr:alpha/beta hydrolase-fold protein [Gammaproteobacteria bacterium]